jgi:hypothetical protein
MNIENRIAADDLRELGRSRLHKDVQADAERLAMWSEMLAVIEACHDGFIQLGDAPSINHNPLVWREQARLLKPVLDKAKAIK